MRNPFLVYLVACLFAWAPLASLRAVPLSLFLSGSTPAASFTAETAAFEAASLEYMRRASAVTGVADASVFSFSCHVRMDTNDASERYYFSIGDGATQRLGIARTSGNFIEVYGVSSAGSVRISLLSSGTQVTTSSGWVHLYVCVDTSNSALCKIYLDGTEVTYTTRTVGAGTIDLETATWRYSVGASATTTPATNTLGGALAELWFDDVYLDDPTKFATAGVPISLGTTGETPTGSAPAIYLSRAGSGNTWATDSSGNANDFTVTGTLSSTTAP